MLFKSIKKRREQKLRKYSIKIASKQPGHIITNAIDIYRYIKYGKVEIADPNNIQKDIIVELEDILEQRT